LKNPFFAQRDKPLGRQDGRVAELTAKARTRTLARTLGAAFSMASAVVIITLLTVAASLASWLFGQWLARRARISAAALAVGGGGAVLLIGALAFVVIGASTWWQKLIPVQDPAPLLAPVTVSSGNAAPVAPTGQIAAAEREEKSELLATAERHLNWSDYAKAIEVARKYLAEHPGDPDMSSVLARSLFAAEHPGVANVMPAAVIAQWPSTDCVAPLRSDDSSLWMLDNGCNRVLAVLFASCQGSEIACFSNEIISQSWSYEPRGILLTGANDRPVPVRLGDRGPLVAPIFTIRDAGHARRQIRYLACEVTAPGVLQVLHESGAELSSQRLTAELRADACYAQVLAWSNSGQRTGASPDALLRNGID
jgi:hypothetical protein